MNNNINPLPDTFIFSGGRQESVPRALFFDKRLTPLERNAWQIIRLMLSDGITAIPTYEQLRQYLTSMPNAEKASFETVARALTILRLTRWLSLARKRRSRDGTRQGNLYILHDDPLTAFEAIRLDDEYLELVCNSITHSSRAIQQTALGVLNDIENDPYLADKRLPTRLETLLSRTKNLSTIQKSEEGENHLLRNQDNPISESEESREPPKNNIIRNPKFGVSSSSNNKKILLQGVADVNLPARFYTLRESQQNGILKSIQCLTHAIQRQVLCEWDERCKTNTIRNPAAYLFGIIQKAIRGELNEFIGQKKFTPEINSDELLTDDNNKIDNEQKHLTLEEREKAQEYIRNLKLLVSRSKF